jgi:endonuclease YncB( thermonuclease family)
MKRLAAALALLLSAAAFEATAGEYITGRVVAVHDGDTVTLLDRSNTQHRIRLAQIDAPEIGHGKGDPGQPFGKASKQSLSELVHGREVRADCETKDKYGRQVCAIWIGQTDVNLEQVRRGMAWVYRKYARDPAYYRAEDEANSMRRGLWSDPRPIAPWEWRHRYDQHPHHS